MSVHLPSKGHTMMARRSTQREYQPTGRLRFFCTTCGEECASYADFVFYHDCPCPALQTRRDVSG